MQIFDGRQVNRLLREIPVEHLADISFSPKETYLTVWTRYIKPNDGETQCMNLNVWNIATGDKPLSFPQKVPAGWDVQWTEDESYCAKQTGSHIQIFDTSKFSNSAGISKLQIEGLSSFSLSPGKRPMISVFANSKGGPCFCKIYDLSNLKQPSAQKTFMRADSVTFNWNAIGTNLLVFTHTDVDVTGQSYYGETNLYYMSISGNFDCRVDLKQPGPIHDVTWAPNSKEFIVVYGSMPARATLFSHRAEPIYELGTGARNHVKYSPSGRFFFIGGFGNVQGDMDIWERKGFKKIATVNGSNSSVIEWSPDGRYLMTAILYKRLKVDNCIKMWHYTGVLAHKIESKEMLQVAWRPEAAHLWPEKCSVSPVPKAIEQEANTEVKKPVGKYVPPGMRAAQNSASLYVL